MFSAFFFNPMAFLGENNWFYFSKSLTLYEFRGIAKPYKIIISILTMIFKS